MMMNIIGWGDLRPPDTPEVRKQLAVEGQSTTLLDIALGIIRRLTDVPGTDPAEMLFLRDCLKAGRTRTVVPCALLPKQDGNDEVGNFLLRTYTRSSSPASAASQSSRSASGAPPSFFMTESNVADGVFLPRWPSNKLDAVASMELETLLDTRFDLWACDLFALSELTRCRPLQFAGWETLRRNNFFSEFAIEPEKTQNFLQRAESSYAREDKTPYHNNLHAADVTQSVHVLLGNIGFGVYFTRLNTFALLLGAIVHDMGHDGRNNAFHVKVQDDLALTYNDQSVLENYHVSLAFKLMSEPGANVLAGLTKEQHVLVRKEMIDSVLGTDMAHHFSKVSAFKDFTERLAGDPQDWRTDPTALCALQSMILHAADISNAAKPDLLSERWTNLLKLEFFSQGDEEKRLGIPVSPLCDRDTVRFASSQVGFIQFIVQPTYALLAELVPNVETIILAPLASNLVIWEGRKVLEDAEA